MTPATPSPLERALDALRRMPGDAGATLAHDAELELEALNNLADAAEELVDAPVDHVASIRADLRSALEDLHRRQRP